MKSSTVRYMIIKEIKLIPEHRLSELYQFVHRLRAQSEAPSSKTEKIMAFAGCWLDMPDDELEQFSSRHIGVPQSQVFSTRR